VKNGRVIIGHAHAISHDAKFITVNDNEVFIDVKSNQSHGFYLTETCITFGLADFL
jgi:hypothetical protein